MGGRARPGEAGFAVALLVAVLLAGACAPAGAAPEVRTSAGKTAFGRSLPGGCSGTVVVDSEPPAWAQAGFRARGAPWPVPWALGTSGDALAYLFASQLVARGQRPNGTSNKILWVARDAFSVDFVVDGRPLGRSQPVVTVPGGPSIVDVPTAGCWTFQLSWDSRRRHSTINLEVLPAGTLPPVRSGH